MLLRQESDEEQPEAVDREDSGFRVWVFYRDRLGILRGTQRHTGIWVRVLKEGLGSRFGAEGLGFRVGVPRFGLGPGNLSLRV